MAASVRRGTMTLLTQAVMVRANIDVDRMSAQQKVELADEIYVQQPNLLASILVLPRYEVDMLQLEVPIHVLLVAFQAMKHCGHALPTISEDVQETCLQRLTATMQFTRGRAARPRRVDDHELLRRPPRALPARVRVRPPRPARPAARAN